MHAENSRRLTANACARHARTPDMYVAIDIGRLVSLDEHDTGGGGGRTIQDDEGRRNAVFALGGALSLGAASNRVGKY